MPKNLEFYRVEDGFRRGIYHSGYRGIAYYDMNDTGCAYQHGCHPQWIDDSLLARQLREEKIYTPRNERYRFGFCSINQLKYWIHKTKWREDLHNHSFVVSHLRADGWHGDTQGVFLPETRVDIATLSLMDI